MDALRDGVLWAYAGFALAVCLTIRPTHFDVVVAWYRKLLPIFACWVVVAGLVVPFHTRADLAGSRPIVETSILTLKADDLAVHLAGVAAFLLIGLGAVGSRGQKLTNWVVWPLWILGVALVAAGNRGGLLALGIALGVIARLRPLRLSRRWLRPLGLAALLVGGLMLANPQFDLGRDRKFAPGEIGRSALSIVTTSREPALEATKSFRLNWWKEIVSYTVTGPYFWTGKGFGVNLADDDGFQVLPDHSLRSPHNSHMTILARMGVPGLALWIALQGMFGVGLWRAFWWARRQGGPRWSRWAQIDAWLLAYWIAMLVTMAFDVYLEGPQGGIWFWSVLGLGIAALTIQDRQRRSEPALQAAGVRAPLPAAH
jgi:O-antigen ligase